MADLYNIEKATQKKKEPQQTNNSILEEAQRLEDENYEQAKDIRKQIGQAAIDQKQATEEMKRQGETLESARRSAINVHKEARRGEDLADDIDREGSIFSCRFACIEKFFKWFKRDQGDSTVKEIESRRELEKEDDIHVEEEEFHEGDEFVPGQNKTDKELYGVLNTVRGIKAEAETQSREAQKQKSTIKDIGRVNEEAEKVIKRTDKHLKEID
jgi:hypothetical protein